MPQTECRKSLTNAVSILIWDTYLLMLNEFFWLPTTLFTIEPEVTGCVAFYWLNIRLRVLRANLLVTTDSIIINQSILTSLCHFTTFLYFIQVQYMNSHARSSKLKKIKKEIFKFHFQFQSSLNLGKFLIHKRVGLGFLNFCLISIINEMSFTWEEYLHTVDLTTTIITAVYIGCHRCCYCLKAIVVLNPGSYCRICWLYYLILING